MQNSPDNELLREDIEDKELIAESMNKLSRILMPEPLHTKKVVSQAGLFEVMNLIMQSMGLTIPESAAKYFQHTTYTTLDLFNRMNVTYRKINLSENFWKDSYESVLAYKKNTNIPVALLYKDGQYFLHDPEEGRKEVLTDKMFADLETSAWTFYRPLQENASITPKKLIKFTLFKSKEDWNKLFWLSFLVAVIAVFIPYAQEILINSILPRASFAPLVWMIGLLFASAIMTIGVNISKNFLELRMIGKYSHALQAAIFYRLLKLPASFFRKYRSGDLALRALGILELDQIFSTASFNALLALPCGMVLLGFIFYHSALLGLLMLGLILFFLLFTSTMAWLILRKASEAADLQGEVTGQVLQYLLGIGTLHITNSETRAFYQFVKSYARQQATNYQMGRITCMLQTFYMSFPVLGFLLLYAAGAYVFSTDNSFNIGQFIAINAALGSLLGILIFFAQTLADLPSMITVFKRLKPVLEALPEGTVTQYNIGDLQGKFEVRGLSFRYSEETPWIFNNLDFDVEPGEFIGLVGPSGAGKSTLLRLLLGFETPSTGNIFYDDKDLSTININSVRHQIGAVIQGSKLVRGNIFTNITGGLNYGEKEAWEVASLIGLDQEIKKLPMGMFTYAGEDGANLSGSQRQLILIARALIRKPKIMFLDEATSQLDETSQQVVTAALQKLNVTRFVIAHRLSTVKQANRILVLKEGHLVESGNFEALMAKKGEFYNLVNQDYLG